MGATNSTPSAQTSKRDDPCLPYLNNYLKCVENHKDGLTEGDDCGDEGVFYKNCRTEQKNKAKSSETSS